jgi:hypothetical protein
MGAVSDVIVAATDTLSDAQGNPPAREGNAWFPIPPLDGIERPMNATRARRLADDGGIWLTLHSEASAV